ncbi:uncharacterized protein LOC129762158 [Toxorhynchites rutilus septentrionalis]|uniref:uncharacterized protein LOC129762158 n=1 Tax=Toxorhynchites rutilus septentrionalis TaxID=329112 RepID=UPI00247A1D78|nr:uncharacterized protein LOC129762158 [Toxorhynchites rutilus septentrionalis]
MRNNPIAYPGSANLPQHDAQVYHDTSDANMPNAYQRELKEEPTILIQVWCHILMRPSREKIFQIVYNTENHLRIIELLLYKLDWNKKLPEFLSAPAVPQRKISRCMAVLQQQQQQQIPGSSTVLSAA